ncbi:amino acid adenylation domain-containing protein [Streptomyces sp. NPDC001606]
MPTAPLSPQSPLSPLSLHSLHRLFTAQAERVPDRIAVRDAEKQLTYAELAGRVRALTAVLHERCPAPGRRIGLHLGRTADLVVAVLAVGAAGHAYVPLDPAYPAERRDHMIEDSGIALVLADQDLAEPARPGLDVLRLDRLDLTRPQPGPVPPAGPGDDDAVAYVIYTSGSTGRPKGVEVRRRNVVAMIEAFTARYPATEHDVWTLFHSYSFDFSVLEMWGALATGGTLVVVPAEAVLSPRACAELLVRERVTVLGAVPSVFRYLVQAVRSLPAPPATVRRVVLGGEVIDPADVRRWRELVGADCEFVSCYGPTEATVLAATATLPADPAEAVGDLGTPLDGCALHLLDERLRPVPENVLGEIWIGGAGVAAGYLNRPDLTAERFRHLDLPDGPAGRCYRTGDLAELRDGRLRFAGREDDQVKINGFRIELGEVETVLRRLPGIRDLAVVLGESRTGTKQLTAYYVPDPARPHPDPAAQAGRVLPRHMVPGRFVAMAELPRSPSGKTDRRALAEGRAGLPHQPERTS